MAEIIDFQKFKHRKSLDDDALIEYDKRQAAIQRLLGYASRYDWSHNRQDNDEP